MFWLQGKSIYLTTWVTSTEFMENGRKKNQHVQNFILTSKNMSYHINPCMCKCTIHKISHTEDIYTQKQITKWTHTEKKHWYITYPYNYPKTNPQTNTYKCTNIHTKPRGSFKKIFSLFLRLYYSHTISPFPFLSTNHAIYLPTSVCSHWNTYNLINMAS